MCATAIWGLIPSEKSAAPRLPMVFFGAVGVEMNIDDQWWGDCQAAGYVLSNGDAERVAILPCDDGTVSVVVRSNGSVTLTNLSVLATHRVIEMLRNALDVAGPIAHQIEVEYQAFRQSLTGEKEA